MIPWYRRALRLILIASMMAAGDAAVGVSPAHAVAAGRVMVVGDSITQGSSGDWTWRYRLYQHLVGNGVTVDFVGPYDGLENTMTPQSGDIDHTYADPAFDHDHDAQWGRTLSDESVGIGGKVTQYQPDYLLVLLGLNDVVWLNTSPAQVEQHMRALVSNARAAKPNVKIVIGRLLPTRRAADEPAFAAKIAEVNSLFANAAGQLSTAQSPVTVAATDAEFVAAQHTYDGIHPNARGELRIAAGFADRLATDFGVGPAYPRNYPELPLGPQEPPVAAVQVTAQGKADLAWVRSIGATAYWVWTKDGALNPDWTRLPIPLDQSQNPWHMEGLAAGVTYQYKLQAIKGDESGVFSNVVTLTMPGSVPGTPTGLTVTPGNGEATLHWTAATDATGYYVHVRNVTAGEASFQRLPYAVPGPEWTAGLLQNGGAYEFKVQAVNGLLEGGTSTPEAVTLTGAIPGAATGLTVLNGDGRAKLSWTAGADATGYWVHVRNVTAGETGFTRLPYPIGGTSWEAGALVNGAVYQFKLQSVNGIIDGATSQAAEVRPTVAPPGAVTGLTITSGNSSALLRWTPAVSATGYWIHVRNVTAGESGFTRLSFSVPGPEWTAGLLVNGATYQFKIQSVNGLIDGGYSAVVEGQPTVQPPDGATGFTVTGGNHEATLRWTPAVNATGYDIYVRNVSAGESAFAKLPVAVPGPEWTAGLLLNGGTYEYKLRSMSGLIEGGFSLAVRVTLGGTAPPAASNFMVQAGNRKAVLTWDHAASATGVYIHVRNATAGEAWNRLPWPVSSTTWTADNLINGAVYEYKIESVNDLILGGVTAVVSVTPNGPPPPAPEQLTVTRGDRNAVLKWTGSSQATGYWIWNRNVSAGEGWSRLPYAIGSDTFTAELLQNGMNYEFKVQSVDGLNSGGYSNTVAVTPMGPTPQVSGLRVTPKVGEALLRWSTSSTATGYLIQSRDVTIGQSFVEGPFAVSGPTFTAAYLLPGHQYEFRVRAISGWQRGVISGPVLVTIPLPPALTTLSANRGVYRFHLTWEPVPEADGYNIYIKRAGCNTTPPERSSMTKLPFPVTGTEFTLDYLFEPGCWWGEVVPIRYGVEAARSIGGVGYLGMFHDYTWKSNDDSYLYESVLTYIYGELDRNPWSADAQWMWNLIDMNTHNSFLAANAIWYEKVRSGGDWDHKPMIKTYLGPGLETGTGKAYFYHVTDRAWEIYFDIWSNIHYGYVGRYVGFEADWLQYWASRVGVDDPGDHRSIDIGVQLYARKGLDLTRADLDTAVRDNLRAYEDEEKSRIFVPGQVPNTITP